MTTESRKIRLALVTGGHSFFVPPFYEVFRAMDDLDFYPQSLDEFTATPEVASEYDVVLFYTMHLFTPDDKLPWYQAKIFSTLEQLGRAGQGIVMLHHSLVAFHDWPFWSQLTGIDERHGNQARADQTVTTTIVDLSHPITQGLRDWTMIDETYEMAGPREDGSNHALLATDHPQSFRTLAWTRQFRDSRVFCYQSGHGPETYADPNFRAVVHNAIRWLAER